MFFSSSAWLVLFIIFIYSSINQLYIPSETTTIPNIVEDKNLISANSLFMFTIYGSFIFGYGLAGPIMFFFGDKSPFILGACLLFFAFLSCIFLPSDKNNFNKIKKQNKYLSVFNELKEAYNYIKNNKKVSSAVFRLTLIQSMIGILAVLIPDYSESILKMNVRTASIVFITPVGFGAIIGALFVSKFGKYFNISKLTRNIIIADGFTISLMGLVYPIGKLIKDKFNIMFLNINSLLIFIGIIVIFLGIENSLIIISSETQLQRETPDRIRGRVFGVFGMFVSIAALLPMLFIGTLADLVPVTSVFAIAGLLIVIYGFFINKEKTLDNTN